MKEKRKWESKTKQDIRKGRLRERPRPHRHKQGRKGRLRERVNGPGKRGPSAAPIEEEKVKDT